MQKAPVSRRHAVQKCSEYAVFANTDAEKLISSLQTSLKGLTDHEAHQRLEQYGHNELAKRKTHNVFVDLFFKFLNPLVVVLLLIAAFSLFFGDRVSAGMVGLMAIISVVLSFTQEYRAGKEAEKLSEMVRATATVYRHGVSREIKMREVVPGDIVDLFAGDMVPADLRIISSKDLFVNQASFTGESFPVEKFPTPVKISDCATSELTNIAFMGSSVVSGTALGVVVRTGLQTQFGEISKRLTAINEVSSFDKGVSQLTWLMLRAMVVLIAVIFFINIFLKGGNLVESLLFSLAVAVGLTPEMLPMVVALNLSKGAIAMSKKKVIVKHLSAIQNFGSMDVLCTDKTGTLTLDKVVLERFCDVRGEQDDTVLRYAYINSFFQTGLKGLLDRTILDREKVEIKEIQKVDEIPFDFERKIMSVAVSMNGKHRLIAKGAPEEIFKRCTCYKLNGAVHPIEKRNIEFLMEEHDKLSSEGFRVLAVAYKETNTTKKVFSKDDEKDLILRGYLAFLDPPKPTAKETLAALKELGIDVKVLTGDNALVTRKICSDVGLDVHEVVTGDQLEDMHEDQLHKIVRQTTVFARLSPFQKERVIRALHANHHVVGYLGDGINDAPALKAADVGISVNNAVDIAKESADLILLQKSLFVLKEGVIEGRKTFANILKYIRMGTSSNFGNMLSMTGATLFLPFLPMLPIQVLLNNFLYDLSQLAIPSDDVDKEQILKPRKWNIKAIRRFMVVFGPVSSIFDFLTFGVLIFFFRATPDVFHTGWFLESLLTQTFIIHILRTEKIPFLQSKPSTLLVVSTFFLTFTGFMIPFTRFARDFGFMSPPPAYFAALIVILCCYAVLVQSAKGWYKKKFREF